MGLLNVIAIPLSSGDVCKKDSELSHSFSRLCLKNKRKEL